MCQSGHHRKRQNGDDTRDEFETALFIVLSYIIAFSSPSPPLKTRHLGSSKSKPAPKQPRLKQESIDRAKRVCPAKALTKTRQPSARAQNSLHVSAERKSQKLDR